MLLNASIFVGIVRMYFCSADIIMVIAYSNANTQYIEVALSYLL